MNKVSTKALYLIAVISIGLIGLAVGSTYAMFTASAEINNPITISSNLTSNADVMETFEVEIEPYRTVTKTIVINNGNVSNVNYGIWYLNNVDGVEIGILSATDTVTGTINDSGLSVTTNIVFRNNSTVRKNVTLGIATSKNSIVLASNMTLVPETVVSEINTFSEYITNMYNNSTKTSVTNNSVTYNYATSKKLMKDVGNNIRYYGASPSNYVYFNCSDYANQSSSTCETWRIIGVFGGKVKIMRGSQIGSYSWDNKNTSTGAETNNGKNDWTDARLMKLLNPGYSGTGGSLYYNSGSGSCYSGQNNATTTCNFTSTGLKNDDTRNMIVTTSWPLLGWSTPSVYTNTMYNYERTSGKVYSGRPKTWTGRIAIPYASDYGYAVDFSKCVDKYIWDYDNSTCTANNWMKSLITSSNLWLLNPYSEASYGAFYVHTKGYLDYYYNDTPYGPHGIIPTLYLNNTTVVWSGTGTSSSPYKLYS